MQKVSTTPAVQLPENIKKYSQNPLRLESVSAKFNWISFMFSREVAYVKP
jgi:hypothetical protein